MVVRRGNGDPGIDANGGPALFAITQDGDPRSGDFMETVEDSRIFPSSIVFASVAEVNQDFDPIYGAARWSVHNVCPRNGAVDVAVSNNWPKAKPFRLTLWIINGYI